MIRDRCSTHKGRAKDRKSTRLNSSHMSNSYAVFCLKKKTGAIHVDYFTTDNNSLDIVIVDIKSASHGANVSKEYEAVRWYPFTPMHKDRKLLDEVT